MKVVVDADISVRWFLPDFPKERQGEQALYLLKQLTRNEITLIQPSYWFAETIDIISAIEPKLAEFASVYLEAMDLDILQTPKTIKIAHRLSSQLSCHLSDTLYHALAIENNGIFVTANQAYYIKAHQHGHIQLLSNWADYSGEWQ